MDPSLSQPLYHYLSLRTSIPERPTSCLKEVKCSQLLFDNTGNLVCSVTRKTGPPDTSHHHMYPPMSLHVFWSALGFMLLVTQLLAAWWSRAHGVQTERSSSCQPVIPALASMKEPAGLKDGQAKLKRHTINDKQVVAPIAVVGSHTVIWYLTVLRTYFILVDIKLLKLLKFWECYWLLLTSYYSYPIILSLKNTRYLHSKLIWMLGLKQCNQRNGKGR